MKEIKRQCKSDKKLNIHYSIILALYWMIFAVSSIYIVPLLRQKGFDNSQIGILISVRSIAAIVVSPIIAVFSDRHPQFQIKNILMILLTVNIINMCIFQYVKLNYVMTVVVFVILGATTNTMPPLHSCIAVKFNENGRHLVYSIGRGMGSISYALISLLLGKIIVDGNYSISLNIQVLLEGISLLCIMCFPAYEVQKSTVSRTTNQAHGISWILKKHPDFSVFLISSVLVFVGYSMCNSFMVDIITSKGGSDADMGISCFILGASELPTAILFPKLKVKFGAKRLLEVSAVFALLKMVCLYLSPNVLCIFFSQTIQMLGNGMYWPASVHYVRERIDGEDQAKGQSLTNMASVNIGAVLGSSVSGMLLCHFDINVVILFGCVCSFIGVVLMFAATRVRFNKVV